MRAGRQERLRSPCLLFLDGRGSEISVRASAGEKRVARTALESQMRLSLENSTISWSDQLENVRVAGS